MKNTDQTMRPALRLGSDSAFVKTLRKVILSEYFVFYMSIAFILILWPFIPRLLSMRNISNVLSNMWPLLAVAVGQTFVLITAGIDLSQTSIMAVTSVVGGTLIVQKLDPILFAKSPLWGSFLFENGGLLAHTPIGIPVAILSMIAVGALIGLINGASVAVLRMPPFIVTLVSMMFFSALAILLPKSENIQPLPAQFVAIGKGGILGIPFPLIIAVVLALAAFLLLSKTAFGRRLYATGINPVAARVSGISTTRIIIAAYVISGICAAVGSILYSARLEMGRPTLASNQLLDIVGANVIGGISLAGGKGKISWTFFGVFFFILLANALNMLNLDFYVIDIVKGLVILFAALLDVLRTRARAASMA